MIAWAKLASEVTVLAGGRLNCCINYTWIMSSLKEICSGLPVDPLPRRRPRDDSIPHAPIRTPCLSTADQRVSIRHVHGGYLDHIEEPHKTSQNRPDV